MSMWRGPKAGDWSRWRDARPVQVPSCWEYQGIGTNGVGQSWKCWWDSSPNPLRHQFEGECFYEPNRPYICHEYLNVCVKFDSRLDKKFTGAWAASFTYETRRKWLARFGLDLGWGEPFRSRLSSRYPGIRPIFAAASAKAVIVARGSVEESEALRRGQSVVSLSSARDVMRVTSPWP